MIDLYYFPLSPPSRAVRILANALGVELNIREINVTKREQYEPENLERNPQHTIPVLVDGGFTISESRAIMAYLATRYAQNDMYYPIDPKKKGIVDHRLYFDNCTLWKRISDCYFPATSKMADAVLDEDVELVEKAFEILNVFLESSEFVAGEHLTIADFSICISVHTAEGWGFDITRYENVAAWFERCKEALQEFDYEEIMAPGQMLGEMLRENLAAASEAATEAA